MSCIFCDILAGKAEAFVVAENKEAVAILDINPWTEGHVLVLSRRHVPWWHDLEPEEIAGLFQLAQQVARRQLKTFRPDFVCLYARGRRIPHTHIFLVPTRPGDVLDRFFNALEGFQEAPPTLSTLREKDSLAAAAKKLRGTR